MSGQPPPAFFYIPAPHEREYYGALFRAADSERTGSIGGAKAVDFLTRSKLPVETLKHIWVAVDQPPTNYLNHIKFAVAIRLIQLEQNGVKPTGPDLAKVPGTLRPPYFEGINPPGTTTPSPAPSVAQSAVSPPNNAQPRPPQMAVPDTHGPGVPPRPPLPQQPGPMGNNAPSGGQLVAQDPYTLTPQERARYEQMFPEYSKDSQYVYGAEAKDLFSKSSLQPPELARIWNMVDVPVDNRLDKLEFAIAMHLIVCVSKKNLPLPAALPISLKQLKAQQHQEHQQQQQQQQQKMEYASPPSTVAAPREMQHPGSGMPSPAAPRPSAEVSSSLPGPPPLPQGGGGLSISDAFEGLGPPGDTGSIASFSRTNQIAASHENHTSYAHQQQIPPTVVETVEEEPQTPTEVPMKRVIEPARPPATSLELAASYDMGESTVELEKLRTSLQKLQAENISLKARLGTMSDEERDIQKELGATIAEITKLSGELTTLRAQVLASKSRLLEASAELKANKEKKGMIQDLIAEATATKEAMDEACEGIEKAAEASRSVRAVPAPVATQEADLFGWGADTNPPLPAPEETTQKTTGFANAFGQHPPTIQEDQSRGSQDASLPTMQQASAPAPQQAQQMNNAPVFSFNQTVKTPGSYNGGGYHNRNISSASGFGEVMGGSADLQSLAESVDVLPSTPSMKEIDDLKAQSREADAVARDAESSHRQLIAQMEELRRLADAAESMSRSLTEKPTKKKGLFQKGKKPDVKEIERVAADAKRKKESLLEVQAQVKDAEALALATRQEAEKLRQRAEDAQIQAATNASMQPTTTNGNPDPTPPRAPVGPSGGYGAFGAASSPYISGPPGNSNNTSNGPSSDYGFGQQQYGGFNSSVMANGGGLDIPTPQNDDVYSNPFSS